MRTAGFGALAALALAFGAAGLLADSPPPLASQAAPRPAPPPAQPSAADQAPPTADQQPPVFETGVKLVLVDVTVTGRGDQPVADLTADDFEVIEDGERQVISQVQFVALDGQPHGGEDSLDIRSPEHARAEAARDHVRLFAVFMDDYHLGRQPVEMIPLRKGLTEFLKQQLGPTDLVTVMNPITPLSALEWTRNRLELANDLHDYEGRIDNFMARSVMEEGHLRTRNVRLVRAQVTISALTALVTHLGALREGRKSVVFVSRGIPLYFREANLDRDFDDLIRAANRSNVVIHVLDPRGLGASWRPDPTLWQLSGTTGGRPILNTNDIAGSLKEVVQDASAYYLLGYAPNREHADGKFHKIDVKVQRPGTKVVARRGYWAPTPEEMTPDEPPPIDPDVSAALEHLALEDTNRLIKIWTGFARGRGGRTVATVAWEPAEGADFGGARPVRLRVSALDEADTEVSGAVAERVEGRRGPSAVSFDVEAGVTRLRFVSETGEGEVIDRWDRAVAVPDYSAVALGIAPPVYLQARSRVELAELRRGAEGTPAAEHSFRASDLVIVRFTPHGSEAGSAEVSAELQSRQGQRLLELKVDPPGAAGAAHVELPLRSLSLGQYVLRLTARAGAHATTQSSAFAIVR